MKNVATGILFLIVSLFNCQTPQEINIQFLKAKLLTIENKVEQADSIYSNILFAKNPIWCENYIDIASFYLKNKNYTLVEESTVKAVKAGLSYTEAKHFIKGEKIPNYKKLKRTLKSINKANKRNYERKYRKVIKSIIVRDQFARRFNQRKMNKVDSLNFKKLKKLIMTNNEQLPQITQVGSIYINLLIPILRHLSYPRLKYTIPYVEKSILNASLPVETLPELLDYASTNSEIDFYYQNNTIIVTSYQSLEIKKQMKLKNLFGTTVLYDAVTKSRYALPIDNKEIVNANRSLLGLDSFDSMLKRKNAIYNEDFVFKRIIPSNK